MAARSEGAPVCAAPAWSLGGGGVPRGAAGAPNRLHTRRGTPVSCWPPPTVGRRMRWREDHGVPLCDPRPFLVADDWPAAGAVKGCPHSSVFVMGSAFQSERVRSMARNDERPTLIGRRREARSWLLEWRGRCHHESDRHDTRKSIVYLCICLPKLGSAGQRYRPRERWQALPRSALGR